ncbi:MAG: KEOPS complex N(6)-L-threonylcarbamoyladenine synthase Kae1 [Conexivisphaera sp.]
MTICLGIESTAHTFGASIVDDGGRILSDVKSTYRPPPGFGIHPRDASRHHASEAPRLIREALSSASLGIGDVDCIAYSAGPGLGPALRVGAVVARTLSAYYSKPLVPVHHAIGHLELGRLLTGASRPVALLVSGGHTSILLPKLGRWRVFGETLDITVGQLIDQLGRSMGLPSPAGPEVESLARGGSSLLDLPYVIRGNDLSFSGMLTAAKRYLAAGARREDVAFSLQETAFAMLCEVSERALAFSGSGELMVVGGVAANSRLSEMLGSVARRQGASLRVVPQRYAGDCGAQIAWTGLLHYRHGLSVEPRAARVIQRWRLDEVVLPWVERSARPRSACWPGARRPTYWRPSGWGCAS